LIIVSGLLFGGPPCKFVTSITVCVQLSCHMDHKVINFSAFSFSSLLNYPLDVSSSKRNYVIQFFSFSGFW